MYFIQVAINGKILAAWPNFYEIKVKASSHIKNVKSASLVKQTLCKTSLHKGGVTSRVSTVLAKNFQDTWAIGTHYNQR